MIRTTALLSIVAFAGCKGASTDIGGGGSYGTGTGGEQDIGHAREIIATGGIPTAATYSPEGLVGEHDLPIVGAPCLHELCPVAAATTWSPVDGSDPRFLVQIGFDTDEKALTFHRPPLDLAVAIDVSGSMDETDRTGASKLDAAKVALGKLVDHLDDRDTMALVRFSDAAVVVRSATTMDDAGRQAMRADIDDLHTVGGTNLAAGVGRAYAQIGEGGLGSRVMLFTDAIANVGNTDVDTFLDAARSGADRGVGLSVFALGVDANEDVVRALADVRGANAFFLQDGDRIAQVFDEDFAFVVTPVAYDIRASVSPAEGLTFEQGIAAPLDGSGAVDLGASTLFLSRSHGGIGVVLAGDVTAAAPVDLAGFDLAYTPASGGDDVAETLDVAWRGGRAFSDDAADADAQGPFVLTGLLDEVKALGAAGQFCQQATEQEDAIAVVDATGERLSAMATSTGDVSLQTEADLMTELSANLAEGEGACVWY